MKFKRFVLALCSLALLGAGSMALAADAPSGGAKPPPKDLFLKGDARCTACHDEADAPDVLKLGKTRHGTVADKRTPTCTSCHGESTAHEKSANAGGKGKPTPPDVYFSKKSTASAHDKNQSCMNCHKGDAKRSHWEGSKHQAAEVACTSCHQMHAARDKVRDKRTQPEVCFTCHKEQRAQVARPSRHPILEGKVACSDCHNVHGSVGPKLVKFDSTNETCYSCHSDKAGPFVRPHLPVNEDCGICHNPHGTTAENLLKFRPPFLCNECHSPHGANLPALAGQSAAPTSVGRSGINYTQGRGCANCHTQVHGSNNPTATNPNPQYLLR